MRIPSAVDEEAVGIVAIGQLHREGFDTVSLHPVSDRPDVASVVSSLDKPHRTPPVVGSFRMRDAYDRPLRHFLLTGTTERPAIAAIRAVAHVPVPVAASGRAELAPRTGVRR